MKESRGLLGRTVGVLADSVAAAARRKRSHEPRVVLYDSTGAPRLLSSDAPGCDRVVELAQRMIAHVASE